MMKNRFAILTLTALVMFGGACSSNKPAEAPKADASAAPAPAQVAPAPSDENALVGEVRSVDPKGEAIVVRTKDGTDRTVHINPDTRVSSLHDGMVEVGKGTEAIAKIAVEDVKKGTMVAVHYTEKEGKLVASQVKRGSKQVIKESEVVVKKIDQEGRKITLQTKDGAEHVYEVGKEATIATGDKLADVGKATGANIAEGTKATVHFSEQQGQKVIHFFQH